MAEGEGQGQGLEEQMQAAQAAAQAEQESALEAERQRHAAELAQRDQVINQLVEVSKMSSATAQNAQERAAAVEQQPSPAPNWHDGLNVSDLDADTFALVDRAHRAQSERQAALEKAMSERMAALEAERTQERQQAQQAAQWQAQQAQAMFTNQLASQVEGFEAQYNDPKFAQFLNEVHSLSGVTYRQMLEHAIGSGDVSRAAAIYDSFPGSQRSLREAAAAAAGPRMLGPDGRSTPMQLPPGTPPIGGDRSPPGTVVNFPSRIEPGQAEMAQMMGPAPRSTAPMQSASQGLQWTDESFASFNHQIATQQFMGEKGQARLKELMEDMERAPAEGRWHVGQQSA